MTDLNTLPLPDLYTRLSADGHAARLFQLAHDEDLGPDNLDATTRALRIDDRPIETAIVARTAGVAAGLVAIDDLLAIFAPNTTCQRLTTDASPIKPGQTLATISGPAGEVLALERTLLNLIARLSGVATLTRQHVDAIDAAPVQILDTRKTTPGWRALEKYAVRCGGGHCHRMGLYDAVLIKDNHLALTGKDADLTKTLRNAAQRARASNNIAFVEVEVDTLDQLAQVMTIEPGLIDIALLDNMPPATLTKAVAMRNAKAPTMLLEASGGVTLQTITAIARTGVNRISIGALTHQATSLDIALDAK